MLAQMPFFLAFYWVLLETVELRHSPFFLWIDDLSAMDPYFILPILNGAGMYLSQKLTHSTQCGPNAGPDDEVLSSYFCCHFRVVPVGLGFVLASKYDYSNISTMVVFERYQVWNWVCWLWLMSSIGLE